MSIQQMMEQLSRTFEKVQLQTVDGSSVPSYAVRYADTKAHVATVGEKYRLVQNTESILPAVERLMGEGWSIATRTGGRSPIRIEAGGRRSYIEMVHGGTVLSPDGLTQGGNQEKLLPRFILGNSVDGTTTLFGTGGLFVLICSNGMTGLRDFVSTGRRRHIGERILKGGDDIMRAAEAMIRVGPDMVAALQPLGTKRIMRDTAEKAVKMVTVRHFEDVMSRLPGGNPTAWETVNAITAWQTYEFKGDEALLARRQREAVNYLREVAA